MRTESFKVIRGFFVQRMVSLEWCSEFIVSIDVLREGHSYAMDENSDKNGGMVRFDCFVWGISVEYCKRFWSASDYFKQFKS